MLQDVHPGAHGPEAFWLQYDKAEKFNKEFCAAVEKTKSGWGSPFHVTLTRSGASDTEREAANKTLVDTMASVLERNGINPDALLEWQRETANQPFRHLMLMAA